MIARVRLALPFQITIPKEEELETIEYEEGGYRITIFPPYQAEFNQSETQFLDPSSMREILEKLSPVASTLIVPTMQLDGKPVFQANALQLIFHKENFDRRIGLPLEEHDPTETFVFKVANDFISKFRSVTQGVNIKLLLFGKTMWKLDYLTDAGEELPQNPNLYRATFKYTGHVALVLLNKNIMTKIKSLPKNYEMQTWETLIIDAEALLPEVRASLVLAYSALETIIAVALDHLITTTSNSPELWEWINSRGFFLKNPSVEEQYTVLLKILTGKSLREETALWKAFTDLNQTRNKIAHTGNAILNNKEVDNQVAGQLIGGAKEIINWLEKLLPEYMRRPKHDAEMQISLTKLLSK